MEQARCLAAYFATQPIGALYTSHLRRSLQTTQAIAQQVGLAAMVEPALAEIHLGAWEGLTPEEVNDQYDGAYHLWRASPSQVRIPGAEPIEQFRVRVRTAIHRIMTAGGKGDIAVVCHGGVIAALLADWLDADYDVLLHQLVLDNAGITALDCQVNPPQVLSINATHHLRSADQPLLSLPERASGSTL